MRILFVMSHPGVNSFTPALRLLAERGHDVHLAFQSIKTGESHRALVELAEECPRVTFGQLPSAGRTDWTSLASELRLGIDYLRYLEPRYRGAVKLRARAEARAPAPIVRAGSAARVAGAPGVTALRRALQALERTIPPPPSALRFLSRQRPDVLLVSPLVELGSGQADWLRAAGQLGIRTCYPVFSWDNLTNKGLLRDVPDSVIVWNELQAAEAVELHGVPRERIRVTGAQGFDHWFDWSPSRTRSDFCREVGLRDDRPIVLYLCSSGFVAPGEPEFVRSWIERLRGRGGLWDAVGLLVRPHPLESSKWSGVELGAQTAVWPRHGEDPHAATWRRNYFDSIHHAAAVVGINTTAQIESAIVGRPVHTLLAPEFRTTQEGTLHFRYLRDRDFGHLHVGRTFEEHVEQLEASLAGRPDDGRNERFLRRFVRPLGLDVPASERFAAAVEELGSRAARIERGRPLAPLGRAALRPFASRAARRSGGRREEPAGAGTPVRLLQRSVRRLARDRDQGAVVAGPWTGDEVGEILYWIPFLRWAQSATFGLRERLVVSCRPETAVWYGGIGARVSIGARPEEQSARGLHPALVEAARADLAGRGADRRIQHRLLDFAPLELEAARSLPELPPAFVAARFTRGDAELAETVTSALVSAGLATVVLSEAPEGASPGAGAGAMVLSGADRELEASVIARAQAFVGTYGAAAYVAVLLGVRTLALLPDADRGTETDLRVAREFLGRAPFGALEVVVEADPEAAARRVLEQLAPVESIPGR